MAQINQYRDWGDPTQAFSAGGNLGMAVRQQGEVERKNRLEDSYQIAKILAPRYGGLAEMMRQNPGVTKQLLDLSGVQDPNTWLQSIQGMYDDEKTKLFQRNLITQGYQEPAVAEPVQQGGGGGAPIVTPVVPQAKTISGTTPAVAATKTPAAAKEGQEILYNDTAGGPYKGWPDLKAAYVRMSQQANTELDPSSFLNNLVAVGVIPNDPASIRRAQQEIAQNLPQLQRELSGSRGGSINFNVLQSPEAGAAIGGSPLPAPAPGSGSKPGSLEEAIVAVTNKEMGIRGKDVSNEQWDFRYNKNLERAKNAPVRSNPEMGPSSDIGPNKGDIPSIPQSQTVAGARWSAPIGAPSKAKPIEQVKVDPETKDLIKKTVPGEMGTQMVGGLEDLEGVINRMYANSDEAAGKARASKEFQRLSIKYKDYLNKPLKSSDRDELMKTSDGAKFYKAVVDQQMADPNFWAAFAANNPDVAPALGQIQQVIQNSSPAAAKMKVMEQLFKTYESSLGVQKAKYSTEEAWARARAAATGLKDTANATSLKAIAEFGTMIAGLGKSKEGAALLSDKNFIDFSKAYLKGLEKNSPGLFAGVGDLDTQFAAEDFNLGKIIMNALSGGGQNSSAAPVGVKRNPLSSVNSPTGKKLMGEVINFGAQSKK